MLLETASRWKLERWTRDEGRVCVMWWGVIAHNTGPWRNRENSYSDYVITSPSHADTRNFHEHTKNRNSHVKTQTHQEQQNWEWRSSPVHNRLGHFIYPSRSTVLSFILLYFEKKKKVLVEGRVWDTRELDTSSMVRMPEGICNETHPYIGRICSDCSNQIFPLVWHRPYLFIAI